VKEKGRGWKPSAGSNPVHLRASGMAEPEEHIKKLSLVWKRKKREKKRGK